MNFCVPLFHPKYFNLFSNKYFELQLDKMRESSYFDFHMKWTKNTHHAGPSIYLEAFGLFLAVDIYDNRHWNYEEECWEDCDTEEER